MQRTQHTVKVGRATPAPDADLAPLGTAAAGPASQSEAPQADCSGEGRRKVKSRENNADCADHGHHDQPADLTGLLTALEAAGFKVHRSAAGYLITRWGWLYAAADAAQLQGFARRVGVRHG